LKVCDPAPNSGVFVFGDDHRAGLPEQGHVRRVGRRHEGGIDRRAVGRPDPGRLGQVLDRDRQPVQRTGERAVGRLRVQLGGGGHGLLGDERDDRVDTRVDLADPGQGGREKFGGGELPGPDQPGELNGRDGGEVRLSRGGPQS